MKPKAVLFWSSGKDSALCLHRLRKSQAVEVTSLLTTLEDSEARVAMHGVREALLDAQAAALGLPLRKLRLPFPCPNALYESKVREALESCAAEGVTHAVFGDLFLEEIRRYRENFLAPLGITPVFPLWGEATALLAQEILAEGFRAVLSCVDLRKLGEEWAGRAYDARLLTALPAGVDPCGENGEFHTFVHHGPIFSAPVNVQVGATRLQGGFAYADLEGRTGSC